MPKVTLELIYTEIVGIKARLDSLEIRMDRLENRMDNLEKRMDRMEDKMDLVARDLGAVRRKVKEIDFVLGDVARNVVTQDEFKTLVSQNDLKYTSA